MSPSEPTPGQPLTPQEPAPPEDGLQGAEKTRLTDHPSWTGVPGAPPPAAPPASKASTANSPFGPGREPPSANDLPTGLQDRYRPIRILGSGGFATVYLAHDSVLDQPVAIKVLRLGLASQNDRDRFLFEARIGAKLRHPNIATVFDIIQTADGLQMIMEYYPGGTLTERIRAKGPLHPRETIDFTRQIAQALAYAHRHQVIHRDVKPANIFLAGEGMVKLGDFGIAAHTDHHEFTQTGMIIGTPLYMPPEQNADSRDVDPRTDIYALGLTMYHMLTGRPPRVVDLESIPDAFRQLVRQSTAPERAERLVSAEQFIAMLDQIRLRPSATLPASQPGDGGTEPESENLSATLSPATSTITAPPAPPPLPPAAAQPENAPAAELPPASAPLATTSAVAVPERQKRGRPWIWGGLAAIALAAIGVGFIKIHNAGRPGGQVDTVATPTPAATPAPTPAQGQIGSGRAPLAKPTGIARLVLPKPSPTAGGDPRSRIVVQHTPASAPQITPAPRATPHLTPAATPTPAPTPDALAALQQAYGQYLSDRPGIASALEIIRQRGGQGNMPEPLRQRFIDEAHKTLNDALQKNSDDLMINLVVGTVFAQTPDSPDTALAAQKYFQKAMALDQASPHPLHFTLETIKGLMAQPAPTLKNPF